MKKFAKEEITQEQIELALSCETAGELVKMAGEHGYEMTEAEAQAYLSELEDFRLDEEHLKKVAGGGCCYYKCGEYVEKCSSLCDCDTDKGGHVAW